MFELRCRCFAFDVGHGVGAALIANQQRVTLREVAGVQSFAVGRNEAAISIIRAASGNAFGHDAARRVFAKMNHLGAGIHLLAAVGNGDGIKFTARRFTAQNAAWIFPGDSRTGFNLRP